MAWICDGMVAESKHNKALADIERLTRERDDWRQKWEIQAESLAASHTAFVKTQTDLLAKIERLRAALTNLLNAHYNANALCGGEAYLKAWSQAREALSVEQEPRSSALSIPSGVYYSAQHDNFYDELTRAGMGPDFYMRWRKCAAHFPGHD